MICSRCDNTMNEIYVKVHVGMGRYRKKPSGKYTCSYCVWKGDEGPGAVLKKLVKSINQGEQNAKGNIC